jgi:hypothetical protein
MNNQDLRACHYGFKMGQNIGRRCPNVARHGNIFCSIHMKSSSPARLISVEEVVKWQKVIVNDENRCDECLKDVKDLDASTYRARFYTIILCAQELRMPLCRNLREYLYRFIKPIVYKACFSDRSEKLHFGHNCNWTKALGGYKKVETLIWYYSKMKEVENLLKEAALLEVE